MQQDAVRRSNRADVCRASHAVVQQFSQFAPDTSRHTQTRPGMTVCTPIHWDDLVQPCRAVAIRLTYHDRR